MSKKPTFEELKVSDIKEFFYERQHPDHANGHGATIEETAATIKKHGLLQPIIFARKITKNGKATHTDCVVAGFRRVLSSREAKAKTIPAKVYSTLTELEANDILVIENLHRQELSDVDVADRLGFYADLGMDQKAIAERVKRSEAYVSLFLRLLKDSTPIREALSERTEGFTEKHARHVRTLPEQLHQKAVEQVKGKTVRETKAIVGEIAKKNTKAMITQQLEEEKAKLEEINKAETSKVKLDEELSELNGQLESLKTDDKEINAQIVKLEIVRGRYFPAKKRLAEAESRVKEITRMMPKYKLKPLKKERDEAYKKAGELEAKIKELRKQIKTLTTQRETARKEAKQLSEKISFVVNLQQERTKLQSEIKNLKGELSALESKFKSAIKGFDALKEKVNGAQAKIVEKRKKVLTQIGELKAKARQLNGKIANRKLVEDRISHLEAELKTKK